jgi:hypothetical protein
MTARDFITMLELYMPDIDASLECKLADTGEPCKIWAAGGNKKVILYIERKEQQ